MRIGAIFLALAVALAGAGQAYAQSIDWQVTGSATIGVTDNVANTPEPPDDAPEGTTTPQADGFGSLSPSVEVIIETPDVIQSLGWSLAYQFYFLHPEANTFSNGLSYGVRVPVRDGVELTFGLSGSQTNLATFNLVTPSPGTPPTPNEGGDDLIFTVGVSQGLSVELSETVFFSQGLSGSYAHTLVDPGEDARTWVASGALGLSKQLEVDTLSFGLGTDAQLTPEQTLAIEEGETVPESLPELLEVLHRFDFNWTRQWSLDWSTLLGAGVVVGYDAAATDVVVLPHPTWRAALTFANGLGTAALTYEHTVQPNLLLRQVTANDNVALTGAMPIPKSEFDVGASIGYQVARAFLPTTGFGPPSGHTILADGSVGWIPNNWFVRLEARYQYSRQIAGVQEEGSNLNTPDLERHAALLTATFGYPESPAAGGASPFVVVPPSSANVEIMSQQAPRSERGDDAEQRKEEKEKREDRERRGGSGD